MKLDKAIEIKRHYRYILRDASLPELIEADNLSIEAMKRHQRNRRMFEGNTVKPLPGETPT